MGIGCLGMTEIALVEAYACTLRITFLQNKSHKDDTESIFLEINIRLRKWLIVGADQTKVKQHF